MEEKFCTNSIQLNLLLPLCHCIGVIPFSVFVLSYPPPTAVIRLSSPLYLYYYFHYSYIVFPPLCIILFPIFILWPTVEWKFFKKSPATPLLSINTHTTTPAWGHLSSHGVTNTAAIEYR